MLRFLLDFNLIKISTSLILIMLSNYFALPAIAITVDIENPLRFTTLYEIINAIIDLLLPFIGAVALVMVLWSAFQFMVSGGNPEKIKTARNILLFALIGFAVFLTASLMVDAVCEFFAADPTLC